MVLVLVAVGLGSSLPAASVRAATGQTVVVPRVAGGLVAVYGRLHAVGLRVSIPRGFSFSSLAPPTVARAFPRTGRRVRRGSVVTLQLSSGPGWRPLVVGRAPRYVVARFVGGPASTAYGWMTGKRLAFMSYLGPLRAGGAAGLFANYRVARQRPSPGSRLALGHKGGGPAARGASVRLTPLTVWAAQPPPSAQTGPGTPTGLTSAMLAGTVTPYGIATTYYFSYGLTRTYGAHTPARSAGWGNAGITAKEALVGLNPATTYHYRLVASNRLGTRYGPDRTFTTNGYYQNALYTAAATPDPFVLDNGNSHSDYWAFATGDLFPVLHSTDLVHWRARSPAMITRPSWVTSAPDWHPWAPSVIESHQPCPDTSSSRCYVMYYVGLSSTMKVNCIGVATSPAPGGPYRDQGPLTAAVTPAPGNGANSGSATPPVGCRDDAGEGNIDPSPFLDPSGRAYLYVSTDNSCSATSCTPRPTISVIPLASDLQHAAGSRVALFSGAPGTWEAAGARSPTVEGPSMELHNGTYYLFYSGGSWQGAYGMGYATATSPTGPFTKASLNPVLAATTAVRTPGGGDTLVTGPHGGRWLVYAGRDSTYTAPRTLRLDPFSWRAGADGGADTPVIAGPTTTPQAIQP
jgi:Glycosyl hydrolases family 43